MKILHITSVIDGRSNSGTARVAKEIILKLNELEEIHQSFLHFDESDDEIYHLHNTTNILIKPLTIPWGGRFLSYLKYALFYRYKYLRGEVESFDIVHWHVARIYPFFFLLPAKKVFVTIHDAGGYILPGVNTLSTRIFRLVCEMQQKWITSFLAVSQSSRDNLVHLSRIASNKLDFFYLGSNINLIPEVEPINFKQEIGDAEFLLCVSRWQPHKNVESIIPVFAEIRKEHPRLKLILVGKPVNNYKVPLLEIQKYDLIESVWITSDLTDSELKFLYKRANIHLFPSIHEGFGLSVLEAMSCGCPCIVSQGVATAEIVGHGGIAVDVSDQSSFSEGIRNLLQNYKKYSSDALERSHYFSWDKSIQKLVAMYSKN